jgi:hypothetical protein
MRNPRSRVWAAGVVAAGLVGYFVSQGVAAGTGTPANKAVAAGSHAVVMQPSGTATLMSATFKTSKPEDLIIEITAECSILTTVDIPGSPTGGATQTSHARGSIRIWAELDGKIVPIQDVSTPPQDPTANGNGTDADKVTFCDRLHERTVSDSENQQDGIDHSKDYIETKTANAFNWLRLNSGSGEHTLVVKAEFTTNAAGGASNAQAIVGNRTLIVEPTKLANAAVISDNGTSTSGQ